MKVKRPKYERRVVGVRVDWLEWSGGRYGATCERLCAENCTIIDRGNSVVTVVFSEGDRMRKKVDATGFKIEGKEAKWFLQCPDLPSSV